MPAIGSLDVVAATSADLWQPANLILTVCSMVCMVTVVSLCTCCRQKVKNRDPEDVYGVVNPAAVTISSGEGPSTHSVQFRSMTKTQKINERHSQPSGKNGVTHNSSTRISAPGRALPQLPADMYTAIDKQRGGKLETDIAFADDNCNPTYESIDPDADSMVDPLYSKVVDVRPSRRERKYDYPVFAGRKRTDGQGSSQQQQPDELLYQSASQIYATGSEDPYSSITSDSRVVANSGDGDSSSAYDPGYAKVKPSGIESKRLERLEKTERELDHLYSKIRRSSSRDVPGDSPPSAGPSRVTMDEVVGPDLADPMLAVQPPQLDSQSVSSRDPSYRYITVRENADIVRERLRQQGELGLGPPVREHYYSTIGNEYETVGDGSSSTYSQVASQSVSNHQPLPLGSSAPLGALSVSTTSTREYVPPPPTSPIPDRVLNGNTTVPPGTTVPSSRSPLPSTPFRSRNDTVERTEPVAGATYAVVSKGKGTTVSQSGSSIGNGGAGGSRQVTSTFGANLEGAGHSGVSSLNSDWNAASRGTATSFAGIQRSFSNSNDANVPHPAGSSGSRDLSTSPLSTVQGIQEFMQRPTLPYVSPPRDTVIGRKVTEERKTVVENRNSTLIGSPSSQLPSSSLPTLSLLDSMTRSREQLGSRSNVDELSPERVHHVEIRRIGDSTGPGVDDIISGRRYRGVSVSSNDPSNRPDMGLNLTAQEARPGPSSPNEMSFSMDSQDDSEGHTSRSRYSSRSGLPLPMNGDDVRRMTERSKKRRQESLEREEKEKKEREETQRKERESVRSSSKMSTDRSRERKKPWKEETEEEKIARLGTIYTAKDYVSTINMGTERPWPLMGSSSPPSLRKDMRSEEDNNNEKTGRQG